MVKHKPKEWHLPSNEGWTQTADKSQSAEVQRGTTACVAGSGAAPLARTQRLGCPLQSVCQGGALKVISLTIHPFYVKQLQDHATGSPISRE